MLYLIGFERKPEGHLSSKEFYTSTSKENSRNRALQNAGNIKSLYFSAVKDGKDPISTRDTLAAMLGLSSREIDDILDCN